MPTHVVYCIELPHSNQRNCVVELPNGSGTPGIIAASIEEEIFKEFKNTDNKYKNKIRSRVANLRDKKNPHLREMVLVGSVSAEKLCRMTPEVSGIMVQLGNIILLVRIVVILRSYSHIGWIGWIFNFRTRNLSCSAEAEIIMHQFPSEFLMVSKWTQQPSVWHCTFPFPQSWLYFDVQIHYITPFYRFYPIL